jgi:CBS domain-containing protein
MLRAALWHRKGDLRSATETSASIGRGFGLALMALGIVGIVGGNLVGGMWWILIGLFIRGAAGASVRQQVVEELFADRPVTDFMVSDPVTVPPDISIEAWLDDYVYRHHLKMYPVVDDGTLLGSISLAGIRKLSEEDRALTRVRDCMKPVSPGNSVEPSMSADELLKAMAGRGTSTRFMVVDDGRLVGMISLKDLLDLLAVRLEVERAGR